MNVSTFKSPALIFFAYIAVALLVHHFSANSFFGHPGLPTFLVIFLAAAFVAFVISMAWLNSRNKKIGVALGTMTVFLAGSWLLPHALVAGSVTETLSAAERALGHKPSIAVVLEPMLVDGEVFRENKDFLRDFGSGAQTHPSLVKQYLNDAREVGVDVDFVAQNGIVRVSDRQALYRATLARAAQGDERAMALLDRGVD